MKRAWSLPIKLVILALTVPPALVACSSGRPTVERAVMCRALTHRGEAVDVVNVYRPTDPLHLALEIDNYARDTEVTASLFQRKKYLAGLSAPTIRGGAGRLGFRFPPAEYWSIGDYRVEVFVGGERMESLHFRVEAPPGAIPSRIESAVICTRLDEGGRPADPGTRFDPSDLIRCVVCGDLGAYSELGVEWYFGERLLRYPGQSHTALSNAGGVCYDFPMDVGEALVPGQYRADVYLDGILYQSLDLRVESAGDRYPALGLVAFCGGVDDAGRPVLPTTSFPYGTRTVYAVYEYKGMTDGRSWEEKWLLDGVEHDSSSYRWAGGTQGSRWAELGSSRCLEAGDYELRLLVGAEVLRRAYFGVEEGDIGDVVYSDDFGDPESGWGEVSSETGSSGYGTGIFRVRVENQQWVVWSTAGQEFDDFVLEADAWQDSGPDDASYGLVARYSDADHFYRFDVGGDGQYAVFESTLDGWVDMVEWTESEAILPRRSVNHIRVICRGSEMSLYVNGAYLAAVRDDSLGSGDIGVFGATFEEGGAALCFDNVKVLTLED